VPSFPDMLPKTSCLLWLPPSCVQPVTASSTFQLVSVAAACGLNTSVPGTYNITFTVINSQGLSAKTVGCKREWPAVTVKHGFLVSSTQGNAGMWEGQHLGTCSVRFGECDVCTLGTAYLWVQTCLLLKLHLG
jgi:hypothetical protein